MARLGRLALGRTAFKATLAFFAIMALAFLGPLRVVSPRGFPVGTDRFLVSNQGRVS
jgi:hypothetical protein